MMLIHYVWQKDKLIHNLRVAKNLDALTQNSLYNKALICHQDTTPCWSPSGIQFYKTVESCLKLSQNLEEQAFPLEKLGITSQRLLKHISKMGYNPILAKIGMLGKNGNFPRDTVAVCVRTLYLVLNMTWQGRSSTVFD